MAVVAGSFLAACSSPEASQAKIAKSACSVMIGDDAELTEDFSEAGFSVADYCDCFSATLASKSEDEAATVIRVSQIFGDLRKSDGLGVDDTASRIEDDIADAQTGPAYGVSRTEWQVTEKTVENVRMDLRRNDGVCSHSLAE